MAFLNRCAAPLPLPRLRARAHSHQNNGFVSFGSVFPPPLDVNLPQPRSAVKPFSGPVCCAVCGLWPAAAYPPSRRSESLPARHGSAPAAPGRYLRTAAAVPPRKPSGHYAGPRSRLTLPQPRPASHLSRRLAGFGASGDRHRGKPTPGPRCFADQKAAAPAVQPAAASRSFAP